MILTHPYPICEIDTSPDAVIKAVDLMEKSLPEKCVITFFRRELEQLAKDLKLPIIGKLSCEVHDNPIYEYDTGHEKICITMPFMTAPGAAATIEELYAMGCNQFIVCGGAGGLIPGLRVGKIIVPVSAIRDEGTSYHYLKPSREVECHKKAAEYIIQSLMEMEIPFATGKTWTTDAIYRETPEMIERRRREGCSTVEMEAAAFFAVSRYYNLPLAQLLYVGDDVSGDTWNSRNWNKQKNVRANLLETAIQLMEKMDIQS